MRKVNLCGSANRVRRAAKAALLGAMVVVGFALASCGQDDNDDDAGTFTPPANATQSEIVQWLRDANAAVTAQRKLTFSFTMTGTNNGMAYSGTGNIVIDRDAKKAIQCTYSTVNNVTKLVEFRYVEGETEYYAVLSYRTDEEFATATYDKTKGKVTTDADKYYTMEGLGVSELYLSSTIPYYTSTWKVENGVIKGHITSGNSTYDYEVTLDAQKRYKSLKMHSVSVYNSEVERDATDEITSISYGAANIAFPSGWSTASFDGVTMSEYYTVTVNWGGNLGSNKFYIEKDYPYLYLDILQDYAPDNGGKTVTGFTIDGTTYPNDDNNSSAQITKDCTATVTWSTAPVSGQSLRQSSAKPLWRPGSARK